MTQSFPITPAHGSVSLKPCREHVTVRICAGRGRAHRYLIGFYRPNALNPACNQSVAISSRDGNWRTAIERTQTHALAVRRFLPARRDILPGILNFCRAFKAAGKPSLRSRVKFCQEPARVQSVLFSPYHHHAAGPFTGLVSVADRHSNTERKIPNVGKAVGEIGNV